MPRLGQLFLRVCALIGPELPDTLVHFSAARARVALCTCRRCQPGSVKHSGAAKRIEPAPLKKSRPLFRVLAATASARIAEMASSLDDASTPLPAALDIVEIAREGA